MSTNTSCTSPAVIEIIDLSGDHETDDESEKQTELPLTYEQQSQSASVPSTSSVFEPIPMEVPESLSRDATKKININRRKSVLHSIRSWENLSFESVLKRKADSVDNKNVGEAMKRQLEDGHIDAAMDDNIDDPEMKMLLRKIAYCRVLSNYLLRQYDMLLFDFQLYSNIDLLMLELKKRVNIYVSIRNSRQQLHRQEKIVDADK